MRNLIIGIDSDVDKNGVAIYNQDNGNFEVCSLSFFGLFDYLKDMDFHVKLVVIEAGWMNAGNYHKKSKFTAANNANIGQRVGANFEVSKKIAEMCGYLQIPYKEINPLLKHWKGPDKKITSKEFNNVSGITCRTNQEERDAGLICLAYKNTK